MNKFEISNFKAFAGEIALDFGAGKKNLLLYGDNGSGKTSLFEAIKFGFFYDRIFKENIRPGRTPEERNADIGELKGHLNNKKAGVDFSIRINSVDYNAFNSQNYQCFLVSNYDINYHDNKIVDTKIVDSLRIIYKSLLQNLYFPEFDIEAFLNAHTNDVKDQVNEALHNVFMEPSVSISFEGDERIVKIEDTSHSLSATEGIIYEFNEAKVNLAIILLILVSIKLLKKTETHIHKLLVIDDIISSMDSTNRIFLVNYLLDNFNDFQLVLFTHNVSYFNLIHYKLSAIDNALKDHWVEYNLYETESNHSIYKYADLRTKEDILQDINNGVLTLDQAGNEVRKNFEATIYEFSKLALVGTLEESGNILSKLASGSPAYLKKKTQNTVGFAADLVDEIAAILSESAKNEVTKLQEITDAIASYTNDSDVRKIIDTLKELKLFEKVIMHQSSHGTGSMPTLSLREIEASLTLINNVRLAIKNFKEKNAYGAV